MVDIKLTSKCIGRMECDAARPDYAINLAAERLVEALDEVMRNSPASIDGFVREFDFKSTAGKDTIIYQTLAKNGESLDTVFYHLQMGRKKNIVEIVPIIPEAKDYLKKIVEFYKETDD